MARPKVSVEVKERVYAAAFKEFQAVLQAAADSVLESGCSHADVVRRLDLDRGEWTVYRNKDGYSFVGVWLRLTDGRIIERRWRVPRQGGGRGTQTTASWGYRNLGYPKPPAGCTLNGRAGGLQGRRQTGVSEARPSRPEVGRAYRRSG